jgi:hypothetical protein
VKPRIPYTVTPITELDYIETRSPSSIVRYATASRRRRAVRTTHKTVIKMVIERA